MNAYAQAQVNKGVIMPWLKRKKVVVRAASLLFLSSCTINANDVQLRAETAQGFKNHEQAIVTIGEATEKIIRLLKEKGIIVEEKTK